MSDKQPTDEELAGWESSPLLDFLSSQQEEGSLDSTAEFSVNLAAAQKKYGRYALPRPSAWILKFVQSATEAGCSGLEIVFDQERVELQFLGGELPTGLSLRDNLQTLAPDTPAEDHLIAGLLALHNMEGTAYVEAQGRRFVPLTEAEPERVDDNEQMRVVFEPPPMGFWSKLRSRLSRTLTVMDELQKWCYASPIELVVDGQLLTDSLAEIPLVVGLLPGQQGESSLQVGGAFERDKSRKKSIYCLWASSRPAHLACAVRIDHRRKVKGENVCLDWVRSGVVVKREATQVSGASILSRVVLPTDGLRFDLTGFNFEETDLARRRRIRGAYHLNQALLSLRGDLDRDSRWQRFLDKRHSEHSFATSNEVRLINQVNSQLETVRSQ